MSRSSPSTFAAIRILRTKGEAGELRSVNMEGVAIDNRRSRGGGLHRERSADGLARQPVMTRLTAFGPLPFLSGSTSKRSEERRVGRGAGYGVGRDGDRSSQR